MTILNLIGAAMLAAVGATVFGATVAAEGWLAATAIWLGTIAATAFVCVGAYLVSL